MLAKYINGIIKYYNFCTANFYNNLYLINGESTCSEADVSCVEYLYGIKIERPKQMGECMDRCPLPTFGLIFINLLRV